VKFVVRIGTTDRHFGETTMTKESSRRQFLKTGTTIGLGAALGGIRLTASASPRPSEGLGSQPKSNATNEINLPPI